MNLKQYIDENQMSYTQFANILGVSAKTIQRYAAENRVPRSDVMALIVQATGGAVMPNDFYDVWTLRKLWLDFQAGKDSGAHNLAW